MDRESDRTRHDLLQNSEDFRSLLNSNSRENSESNVETMRLVSSEISKQMDGLREDLNSQIIDAIKSVINENVLPDIRNTMTSQNPVLRDELDYRSGTLNQTAEEENTGNAWKSNSKPILTNSSKRNYLREVSGASQSSDEGHDRVIISHDMVTGANPTHIRFLNFLMDGPCTPETTHKINISHKVNPQKISLRCKRPVSTLTPSDASHVLVGMNSKPSAQTLMVRPFSTTTLTFDGKSRKFELFGNFFHTMIKMQPEMTESMNINHFHSLLRKNALQTLRNNNSANRQTLEDVLAVFRRKYVRPESQATSKHK